MKASTSYAVTDRGVIIAKGSKKKMLRLRADLASKDYDSEKGMINPDSRYHVYLAIRNQVGDQMA